MQKPMWAIALLLGFAGVAAGAAAAQTPDAAAAQAPKPYAVEYYYRVRWGHLDEFLGLYRKNHYPVLKKEMELGRILEVRAVTPQHHLPEESRWDLKVTIVFRDARTANEEFDAGPIVRELYPDQETFQREEQRRFQLLEAHWDVPLRDVKLETQ